MFRIDRCWTHRSDNLGIECPAIVSGADRGEALVIPTKAAMTTSDAIHASNTPLDAGIHSADRMRFLLEIYAATVSLSATLYL